LLIKLKINNMEAKKEKGKGGRPRIYTEKTRSLSMQVPISAYDKLYTILDYELDKYRIKK